MEAFQLREERPVTADSLPAALARRALDLIVAGALLLALAPVLLAIALAIRLESGGPAIFRQRRLGRHSRPFTLCKFRSMRRDADATRHREYVRALIESAETGGDTPTGDNSGDLYKLAVDDRITAVGRFIRKWSLDELPQLWNVVRGDMSLVGPRPVIDYEAERYPGWYAARFAVKPGLTGLWQVSGRNERTYEEMVRFDIDYARRQSLGLDLVILAKTPWTVLTRRGAA
jgi:lipopolysaccharide/colanic/teichoic acid biosynthesis glycosyltransferase